MERKLSELENLYGDPSWRQLQTGMVDLSQQPIRTMVSLLAATMFLRTPEHLKRHREIHSSLVDATNRGEIEVEDPSDWEDFRDADEDGIKRMWLDELGGAVHHANLLKAMRWSVLFSEGPGIITSDNPITFAHPSMTFRGIGNRDTIVMFPLSPTRILMMDHKHEEPSDRYHPIRQSLSAMNLLIWRGAIEHIFSYRHPDEVCRELVANAGAEGLH